MTGTRSRIAIAAIVLVVAAFGIALVAGRGSSSSSSTAAGGETGNPAVMGASLPDYSVTNDPGVGRVAPIATGTDFSGNAVTIGKPGTPQLVAFVAHWCPHCQAEIPRLVTWQAEGLLTSATKLVTVATATVPSRPNYPPSAWLAREKWTQPVLVDSADATVAKAYGLTGFPFFVAIDRTGSVVARASGELQLAEVQALLAATAR